MADFNSVLYNVVDMRNKFNDTVRDRVGQYIDADFLEPIHRLCAEICELENEEKAMHLRHVDNELDEIRSMSLGGWF